MKSGVCSNHCYKIIALGEDLVRTTKPEALTFFWGGVLIVLPTCINQFGIKINSYFAINNINLINL